MYNRHVETRPLFWEGLSTMRRSFNKLVRSLACTPYNCPLACSPYHYNHFSFTRRQILHSSKLKGFADDNFSFDKNGRKVSKWVENTVGKGEIARYEQFLLFPQCFQKSCFPGRQKVSLCGNGLIHYIGSLDKCYTSTFNTLISQCFLSLCGTNLTIFYRLGIRLEGEKEK